MQTGFLPFRSSRISYSHWGTGPKLLLCFHGYGESAASFSLLEPALGRDFTILAIDMPFHGATDWQESLFFDPAELPALIEQIIGLIVSDATSPSGLPAGEQRWWIMGYSMGGRVALGLLEKMPLKIEKVVLLAPDGLKMNRWYWLATQTRAGNRLFRLTMARPYWFLFILRMADRLHLANRSIYKFIVHYIDHAQVRDDLYKRWTTMRGFRPDLPAIQSILREQQIPMRLVYGRYDRIIRPEKGERFSRETSPWCKLSVLNCGHQLLQDRNLDELAGLMME